MNTKNFKTMDKKSYIQPNAKLMDYDMNIMNGPVGSIQYDDDPHIKPGEDDGDDNFTIKERNPWENDLW